MRRIVVMTMTQAGIACASRIKSACPEDEVIALVSAAGTASSAAAPSPAFRRLGSPWPDEKTTSAHGITVMETESIYLDFEENTAAVSTSKGTINLKYHELIVETQSLSRIPHQLQNKKNVFPCPIKAFAQDPNALDAALKKAQKKDKPVLVAGSGLSALNSVFIAMEYGLRVYWLETTDSNVPYLDQHFDDYIVKRLYPKLVRIKTELPAIEAVKLEYNEEEVFAVTLPDGNKFEPGLCFWAETFLSIHPLIREDGFILDEYGRMALNDEAPANVHLIGSGVFMPAARVANGAFELPSYIGSEEMGMASALYTAEEIAGNEPELFGLIGAASAAMPGMSVYKGGITASDADLMKIPAEHATMLIDAESEAENTNSSAPNRICLNLSAHKESGCIIGYQIIGEGSYAGEAQGLAGMLNAHIFSSDKASDLSMREYTGELGRILSLCATRITQKIRSSIFGISPHEILASKDAGADFFVMDLRNKPDWEKGHIEEAYNIPILQMSKRVRGEVPRYVPIVLICEDGINSFAAASVLSNMGAKDVFVLDGGMKMWTYALERK